METKKKKRTTLKRNGMAEREKYDFLCEYQDCVLDWMNIRAAYKLWFARHCCSFIGNTRNKIPNVQSMLNQH